MTITQRQCIFLGFFESFSDSTYFSETIHSNHMWFFSSLAGGRGTNKIASRLSLEHGQQEFLRRKYALESIRDTGLDILVADNKTALLIPCHKHELLVCPSIEL